MGEGIGRSRLHSNRPKLVRSCRFLVLCNMMILSLTISGTVLYTGSLCSLRSISSARRDGLCSRTGSKKFSEKKGLSIYTIENEFGALQYAYVLHQLCYNGSHLISTSDACIEPEEALEASIMRPVPCSEDVAFRALRNQIPWESGFTNFSKEPSSWMSSRKRIRWRNGTSAALHLGPATTNVAHFLARVNPLHVLNNATVPAFTDTVKRFLILRHRMPTRLFDKKIDGIHGFHGPNGFLAVVLADILAAALGGFHPTPDELVLTTSAADGMVELDKPFWDSTDEQPLCFDKVLLFSLLKGVYWPGGPPVADIVRARLKKNLLGLDEYEDVRGGWGEIAAGRKTGLKLLYVFRKNTRRVFSNSSEMAFREVLRSVPGYQLRIIDFKPMQFKDQLAAVLEADVIISLHGANLVNPTTFGRRNSVVIEIIPYKVVHRMYETQAINTGLVYMAVRCSRGPIQEEDHKYLSFSGEKCMLNPACKLYYVHTRHIDLTQKDISDIRQVLVNAHLVSSKINSEGKMLSHRTSNIPAIQICKPFGDGYNSSDPRPWLSYKIGNTAKVCYID